MDEDQFYTLCARLREHVALHAQARLVAALITSECSPTDPYDPSDAQLYAHRARLLWETIVEGQP